MKIATWNINGIKARHDNLIAWLKEAEPDIACLQEIKSIDENFPADEIEALGYRVETHGQKGFNGVAILSKIPIEEINRGLPMLNNQDEPDVQARFIEGVFRVSSGVLRLACLYLPNGNPVDTEKYPYKLSWMARLEEWAARRLELEEPLILAGDFNVIPQSQDCHDPKAWEGDALYREETHEAFRKLCNLGFTEAVRNVSDQDKTYTFWDYQAGAWQKNNGIRIDHFLMSAEATDRFEHAGIDKYTRDWERPSDHVPVRIDYSD